MPRLAPIPIVIDESPAETRYGYCKCGCGQKTSLTPQNHTKRNRRKGEPEDYLAGHANRISVVTRFWRRVDKNGPVVREGMTPCWVWTGGREKKLGYGRISIRHTLGVPAHRLSYVIHFGSIPDGLQVLHKCDNGPCVNPDHLFVGTGKENMEDAVRKGRMAYGERVPVSRLTEQDIIEIRRKYVPKVVSAMSLAREYGVCKRRILDIVHGRAWQHVADVSNNALEEISR